jgi:rhodanese-related sulfurtransferase
MKRQIKDSIYSQIADLSKAFASPKRLEILDLLAQGEKTVEQVSEQAGVGLKNASAQLQELKNAHLVESRREGKYVFYRLASMSVARFLISVRLFAEDRLSNLRQIVTDALSLPEELEAIDRKSLFKRAKQGEIVIIDVRPPDEFENAHLPFAQSVPMKKLNGHLKRLPKSKEIVAYCRGPYCFLAVEAVEILKKKGFKATHLKDSVHDWSAHGLPLEGKWAKA